MSRNELVNGKKGELQLGKFTLHLTGLEVAGKPTYEEWETAYQAVERIAGCVLWWVGDLLNYGEWHYGETYAQAMGATSLDYSTLRTAKWVSTKINLSRRRDKLTWSHHQEVAALPPQVQDQLLLRAEKEEWSCRTLRSAVKEVVRQTTVPSFPDGVFSVIYADPPWQYADERTALPSSGAVVTQYATLPTELICSLRDGDGVFVGRRIAPEAALFLWATAPCLLDAFEVMHAWGFAYKAQFVWDKVRGFNGHYNDVQHELLLIGLRGSFPPQADRLRESIVSCEKTSHSRKPDIFYEVIEEMYPPGQRTHLELFARNTKRPGWSFWGNEP